MMQDATTVVPDTNFDIGDSSTWNGPYTTDGSFANADPSAGYFNNLLGALENSLEFFAGAPGYVRLNLLGMLQNNFTHLATGEGGNFHQYLTDMANNYTTFLNTYQIPYNGTNVTPTDGTLNFWATVELINEGTLYDLLRSLQTPSPTVLVAQAYSIAYYP